MLSQAPVKQALSREENKNEAEVKVFMDSLIQSLPATEAKLKEIAAMQKNVHMCDKLINYSKTEWPEKYVLPHKLVAYDPEKKNLTVAEELLRRHRIETLSSIRQEILSKL